MPKYRFDGDLMACSIDVLAPITIGEDQGDQEMPPCYSDFVYVRRPCQRWRFREVNNLRVIIISIILCLQRLLHCFSGYRARNLVYQTQTALKHTHDIGKNIPEKVQ